MSAEPLAEPQSVADLPHPKRRRRWWRLLAAMPLLLFVLAFLAPYGVSLPAVRNWLLATVARDVKGDVRVGDLSLGWFSPIAVSELQVSLGPESPPVIELPLLAGNKPLWRVLSNRRDVDHFRLEGAKLNLVFGPDGESNLKKLLPPFVKPTEEELRRASWRRFGGQLSIVDAGFTVVTPKSEKPWGVRGLNLTVSLHPQTSVPDSSPVVVLERGTVLSHTPITRDMCNDALKFVAPILANVTWAEGDISLDIDRCRLPLDHAKAGDVAGRFSIHKVEVGSASPFVRELSLLLGVSAQVSLAENSVVRFEMHDGRVHHHDLEFGLANARVRTSGSVGLEDHTLDLTADLPIPVAWLSDRPMVQALSEQRITLAIKGTLEKPEIDAAGLRRNTVTAFLNSLRQARGGEAGATAEEDATTGIADNELLREGVAAGAELLGGWLKNRAEGERLLPDGILGRRRRQDDNEPQPPAVSLPLATTPAPDNSAVPNSDAEKTPARAASSNNEQPQEVTANRPSIDEPPPERRRFRLFDRLRERRDAQDEKQAEPAPAAPPPN